MMESSNSAPGKRRSRKKAGDRTKAEVYSITICTANRKNIFSNKDRALAAIEAAADYSKRFDVICYVCCVMPDHIHLVLQPDGDRSVTDFIGSFKGRISNMLSRWGFKGKIWQKGFHDHVLLPHENLEDLIFLILTNPERNGLVGSYKDYPWSFDSVGIKDGNKRKSE